MSSKGVFFYEGKPYDFGKLGKNLQQVKKSLPPVLARVAVEHFKDSFQNQGFTDTTIKRWDKRKPGSKRNKGRAILVDTGDLRNAVQASKETFREIVISNDKPYAQKHNEGFRGVEYVKPHHRKTKHGRNQVRGFARKVNMPQRQFMGNSAIMEAEIERIIDKKVMTIFE